MRPKLAALAASGVLLFGCASIIGIEDRHFEEAEQTTPECKAYCDAIMKGCVGELAAYPDRATCVATCEKFPSGEATSDNSVECRTVQAELAVSTGEPGSHCAGAGPFGAGVCGSTCAGYCSLLAAACTEPAVNVDSCAAACAGLRSDAIFDLGKLASGDNVECRVAEASLAARFPKLHCGGAQLKSGTCVDEPKGAPDCDDVCRLIGAVCSGANAVYESEEQCLSVCKTLDPGENSDQTGNTAACRKYHAYNSIAAPGQHCPHTGPGGDGHCGKDNCESYCLLLSRACKTEFQTFGDQNACRSACAKLPGAGLDTWKNVEPTGNNVRCRLVNVARATVDPAACAAAAGGGECS
ncbi:MAG: hypothetical protein U0263_29320 [Polyangiaceae bacterium]